MKNTLVIQCPNCKKWKLSLDKEDLASILERTGEYSAKIKLYDCPECGYVFTPSDIQEARDYADSHPISPRPFKK